MLPDVDPQLFRLVPPRTDYQCIRCARDFQAEAEEVRYQGGLFASATCPVCGEVCGFAFWPGRDCPVCAYYNPDRPDRPCSIISGGQTLKDQYKPCSLWLSASDRTMEIRVNLLRRFMHAGIRSALSGDPGGGEALPGG